MPLSFNLIETRQISGVGTINVTSGAEPQGSRIDVLLFDLIRPATNRYRNFNWFPPRERIANVTFRNNTIVVKSAVIEYERQVIYDVADISGQTLIAVQCAYKGILQTFFNLGNALSLPSISVQNDIGAYSRLETPYNQVVVKCYADSAVAVSLFQLNYEQCGSDSGSFQSLTGLPSPPAQTDPGDTITPSPPYDPNDANEPYEPSPLDVIPEPEPIELPVGSQCQVLDITYRAKFTDGTSEVYVRTRFGPVNGVTFSCGINSCTIFSFDFGDAAAAFPSCRSSVGQLAVVFLGNPPTIESVSIINAVPV